MDILEQLKDSYVFGGLDRYFSTGPRRCLRYACGHLWACLMEINPDGPDPIEYLDFAKADILNENLRGAINAIGNAKRAIHLLIESFFEILGLTQAYDDASFPAKLTVIEELDAFPTRLLASLNRRRNLIEHDYQIITMEEAEDFVDIAEMFLRLCYPFLKQTYIGLHVGVENDTRDLEWRLDPVRSQVTVLERKNSKFVDSPFGRVYYNFTNDEADATVLEEIVITREDSDSWVSYLNAMVYWSKKCMIPSPPPYDSEDYQRLMFFRSSASFN